MNRIEIFNGAIMKMVHGILWYAPLGIAFLIASKIAENSDQIGTIVSDLGLFIVTVISGLLVS